MENDFENVTLFDENGNEVEFEVITKLDIENNEYFIVVPIDSNDDEEAIVLKVDKDEEGKEILATIEDDDEFDMVAEAYEVLFDE